MQARAADEARARAAAQAEASARARAEEQARAAARAETAARERAAVQARADDEARARADAQAAAAARARAEEQASEAARAEAAARERAAVQARADAKAATAGPPPRGTAAYDAYLREMLNGTTQGIAPGVGSFSDAGEPARRTGASELTLAEMLRDGFTPGGEARPAGAGRERQEPRQPVPGREPEVSPEAEQQLWDVMLAQDEAAYAGGRSTYHDVLEDGRIWEAALGQDEAGHAGGRSAYHDVLEDGPLWEAALGQDEAAHAGGRPAYHDVLEDGPLWDAVLEPDQDSLTLPEEMRGFPVTIDREAVESAYRLRLGLWIDSEERDQIEALPESERRKIDEIVEELWKKEEARKFAFRNFGGIIPIAGRRWADPDRIVELATGEEQPDTNWIYQWIDRIGRKGVPLPYPGP